MTRTVVGADGWKSSAVMASVLCRTHVLKKQAHVRPSQQRMAAGFPPHCWQMCYAGFSCATAAFTRRDLSALQLSEGRLICLLRFDEANRESPGGLVLPTHPLKQLSKSAGYLVENMYIYSTLKYTSSFLSQGRGTS